MGRNGISWSLVPRGMVNEMWPNYSAGDGNYLCEDCALRCCSCSVCTCSSSSLIRRSLFANCFLKSFSSSHCSEYALCNWNTKPCDLLISALFVPETGNKCKSIWTQHSWQFKLQKNNHNNIKCWTNKGCKNTNQNVLIKWTCLKKHLKYIQKLLNFTFLFATLCQSFIPYKAG